MKSFCLFPRTFLCIFRGKKTGHDVDILITHPEEGREVGVLARLLWHLQSQGVILCGKCEKSTFTPEVLHTDFKLSMRGQLDHFEKWIGIFKVPKFVSLSKTPDTDVNVLFDGRSNTEANCKTEGKTNIKSGFGSEPENTNSKIDIEGKNKHAKIPSQQGHTDENEKQSQTSRNSKTVCDSEFLTTNLNESIDDYESNAKKQRTCEDSELSPLEMSKQPRDWLARRVDLIVSPYSQYYYALVGWTGNKQFNRDLRTYAKKELGMHLTSHGLYEMNTVNMS